MAIGDLYEAGLSSVRESVVSEHFMSRIGHDPTLGLYTAADYRSKAINIPSSVLYGELLPILKAESLAFVERRVAATRIRAQQNFLEYGRSSPNEVSTLDFIAEVMFDRQFARATKEGVSRAALSKHMEGLVQQRLPVHMVIPALPFKCTSPFKARGRDPDLGEVGFLLSLFEVARVIDVFYSEALGGGEHDPACFSVICDGRRFAVLAVQSEENISQYQDGLRRWVAALGIGDHMEVLDYEEVLATKLPKDLLARKGSIRGKVYAQYVQHMQPLLDVEDMDRSLVQAIRDEIDPETYYSEGRFVPLFKSLIHTIRYQEVARFAQHHGRDYEDLHAVLTRNIFTPFIKLSEDELHSIARHVADPDSPLDVSDAEVYEYLRRAMLNQAWDATMQYLAEIRSDRDLELDPLSTCFPHAIRWTIHAKRGQFTIQSNPACGFQVQPWHGAGVFKRTRGRLKLCSLPIVLLEGKDAVPVVVGDDDTAENGPEQAVFYVSSDVPFSSTDELLAALASGFTRRRR